MVLPQDPSTDRLTCPQADAVKGADGVWRREFASGTKVTFDGSTGKGTIAWGGGE